MFGSVRLRQHLEEAHGVERCTTGSVTEIDLRTVNGYGVATVPLLTNKDRRLLKRKADDGVSCTPLAAILHRACTIDVM